MPGAIGSWKNEGRILRRAFRRSMPCGQLGFRLRASRTVGEHISAVLSCPVCMTVLETNILYLNFANRMVPGLELSAFDWEDNFL